MKGHRTLATTKNYYKDGQVFFYQAPNGRMIGMAVLSDGGPLCVSRVFNQFTNEMVPGLYWIYLRKHGAHFGPFFAEITLADRAMKKILKQYKPVFFDQPVEWLKRQTAFQEWVEKHIGKNGDLIGGEWEKDEDTNAT